MYASVQAWWVWLEARMRSPYAPAFLFLYSFFETIVTVIPIDPFALAVMVANQRRVYFTAFYIVVGSLSGALFGYWVGRLAFEEWGVHLLALASPSALATFDHIRTIFFKHEFLIVFTTAFVPIPKTPTILAAGVLNGSIGLYLVAWVLGRSLHFFAEALLVQTAARGSLSYSMRAFSVGSIIFLFIAIAYIALSASGLA